MKKILLSIFILLLISISACKQAVKKEIVEKKEETPKIPETPKVETTGNAAVDAVGNDLNSIQSVEKDLGAEELDEIDSGLQDIENI